MSLLEELNPRQKEAVLQKDGPVLILAGAGAGKTKTVTYRIINLIREGVAPNEILAITFTNKAAKEMRNRVFSLITKESFLDKPSTNNPFVSTFHSLGVHILKENHKLLDIPKHFSIFDKSDSKRAVKTAMEEVGADPKQTDPGIIQNFISRQKGNSVTFGEFKENIGNDYFPRLVSSVWERYESILRKEKAFDFDDLLLKTSRLLKNNKEILSRYQNQWKYIHIDEYQDTNKVQYEISKLLGEKHRNICVVGDIDQNIYSWRGADIRNILNFEKDYPEAKVILLEENYRSTQNILNVANIVIEKNKMRRDKKLFTKNPSGEKIGLYEAYDEADEADFVTGKIQELVGQKINPKEMAVLFRANFQSRALEESFLARNIPYQLLGTKFFERKEVKDVLSYLRASLNKDSLSDIKRIINVPARGIGKVTLLKIFEGKENELPSGTRKKIENFRNLLREIEIKSKELKTSELMKFIIKESGLEQSLKEGNDEDAERLENIGELVTLATKYDGMGYEEGIEKLLTDSALASDQDELEHKELDTPKLMTVHASKGLEFDYVFITGLEENLFPHKKTNENNVTNEEAEEERRLFYVALTRARKKVFLSYSQKRTIFGSKQINIPSEFVFDVPDELIEKEFPGENITGRKPLFSIEF